MSLFNYTTESDYGTKTKSLKLFSHLSILVVLVISFLVLFPYAFTTVKTYESAVQFNWGEIQDETTHDGLNFFNPIRTSFSKIDMRERTTTINTTTVSKEGLKFGVVITVRYEVKEGQAVALVKGLQTELHTLINTYANSTIDDVATGKDKNEMYSDIGRVAIVQAVKEKLNVELSQYATINQVVFEDIELPASITDAIEKQQAELEKIKQKENEKQVAIKQAEIRRIEAQGIADANKIIQWSLTQEYLQYEAIQKLNPSAQKIFIPSVGVLPVLQLNK